MYHMECATQGAQRTPGNSALQRSSAALSGGGEEGSGNEQPDPGAQLVFLYKLKAGPCPKSYGLQVAAMAGIPSHIVQRGSIAASCMEDQLKERFSAALGWPELPGSSLAALKQLCQVRPAESFSQDARAFHDTVLGVWETLQMEQ